MVFNSIQNVSSPVIHSLFVCVRRVVYKRLPLADCCSIESKNEYIQYTKTFTNCLLLTDELSHRAFLVENQY